MPHLKQVAATSSPAGKLQIAGGALEFYGFTFTLSAEGANIADGIDFTCQLTDPETGQPIKKQIKVTAYTSGSGGTQDFVAVTSGAFTVITGTQVRSLVANCYLDCLTDANGVLGLRVVLTGGAATRFMNITLPDGRIVSSPLATWA